MIVGEKGNFWCTLTREGHARPRLAAVPDRQRAGEGGRGRAPARRVPAGDADPRHVAAVHLSMGSTSGRDGRPAARPRPALATLLDALPGRHGPQFHACTHTTFAPNIVHGGTKINMIPDTVELERRHPHAARARPTTTCEAMLAEALGDLVDDVESTCRRRRRSTASPVDTPLWDTLSRVAAAVLCRQHDGARILTVGATDARFFRRVGHTAYGFGMFSEHMTFEDYGDDVPRRRRAGRHRVACACRPSSGKSSPRTCCCRREHRTIGRIPGTRVDPMTGPLSQES